MKSVAHARCSNIFLRAGLSRLITALLLKESFTSSELMSMNLFHQMKRYEIVSKRRRKIQHHYEGRNTTAKSIFVGLTDRSARKRPRSAGHVNPLIVQEVW